MGLAPVWQRNGTSCIVTLFIQSIQYAENILSKALLEADEHDFKIGRKTFVMLMTLMAENTNEWPTLGNESQRAQ